MCNNTFPFHIDLEDYKVGLITKISHIAIIAVVWVSDEMLPTQSAFFEWKAQ